MSARVVPQKDEGERGCWRGFESRMVEYSCERFEAEQEEYGGRVSRRSRKPRSRRNQGIALI